MESGDEGDKKPNARILKRSRKKGKKSLREEEMPVDAEDADTLPSVFENPDRILEEQPAPISACSSPGPVDLSVVAPFATAIAPSMCIDGTFCPLKRRASPSGDISPTPSKRPRAS